MEFYKKNIVGILLSLLPSILAAQEEPARIRSVKNMTEYLIVGRKGGVEKKIRAKETLNLVESQPMHACNVEDMIQFEIEDRTIVLCEVEGAMQVDEGKSKRQNTVITIELKPEGTTTVKGKMHDLAISGNLEHLTFTFTQAV